MCKRDLLIIFTIEISEIIGSHNIYSHMLVSLESRVTEHNIMVGD